MKELTLAEAVKALKEGKKVKVVGDTTTFRINEDGELVDEKGVFTPLNYVFRFTSIPEMEDFASSSKRFFFLAEDPILDEKEKEYLGNIVRPFKGKYKKITIVKIGRESCFISIKLLNKKDNEVWKECINLPFFRKGEMYKGMEENREYTLEELGL